MTPERLKEIEETKWSQTHGYAVECVRELIAEVRRLQPYDYPGALKQEEAATVARHVVESEAEVTRLRAERVSYKAKLVDQKWEIEEAARKPMIEEIERLRAALLKAAQEIHIQNCRAPNHTDACAAAMALLAPGSSRERTR